jgi:hypothetical protein
MPVKQCSEGHRNDGPERSSIETVAAESQQSTAMSSEDIIRASSVMHPLQVEEDRGTRC